MNAAAPRFSAASVTRAQDKSAHKFIITGRSGIGKTFFSSTIPTVFIVPIEEGLKGASPDHHPAHFGDVPRNIAELHQALDAFTELNVRTQEGKLPHQHLVLDSISGIERLVHDAAMAKEGVGHMEGKAYKVVWSAAKPIWLKVQQKLDEIRRCGVHVWLIAHSAEGVESTDAGEIFRKWDLQFVGSSAALQEVRELWRQWADHVLFIDWDARVKKGGKGSRSIGEYRGRVLYTQESPSHYAKTRSRIPAKLPATWTDLARAMAAGAPATEGRLRAEIADIVARLSSGDAALIADDLAAAKSTNALATILSRAQGLLSVADEGEGEEDGEPERGVTTEAPPVEVAVPASLEPDPEPEAPTPPPPSAARVVELDEITPPGSHAAEHTQLAVELVRQGRAARSRDELADMGAMAKRQDLPAELTAWVLGELRGLFARRAA